MFRPGVFMGQNGSYNFGCYRWYTRAVYRLEQRQSTDDWVPQIRWLKRRQFGGAFIRNPRVSRVHSNSSSHITHAKHSPKRPNYNRSRSLLCTVERFDWYFVGPHHFPETSFHRIVAFVEIQFCRIVFVPKKKIAESHLTQSYFCRKKIAESHLTESYFCRKKNCRKSFDRIVTWPNRRISETS